MNAFDPEHLKTLTAAVPAWRAAQMEAAYQVFDAMDEPTGAEEDWRYVDFGLRFSDLAPAGPPGDPLDPGPFLRSIGETEGRALIVDGTVVEAESETVSLTRLADVDDERPFTLVPTDHNKLAAAHAAFASDALFVDVPAGQVMEAPVVIEVQATAPGTASFPHLSVRVGEHAEARILVVYRSGDGAELLTVPEVDLDLADGAIIRYLSVQALDFAATGVVHQRVRIGRDATSRIGEVGLGGHLGRLDLGVDLVGDGSSSEMVGVYFGEDNQTLDYRVVIDHFGRNTSSEVFLKGAVEDSAESVFTGLLRIEKEARRTQTFETNRNLVLSENAKAHSVPNLEILCDDVVCGHASSVGPLEEDQLYYLQSRGLSKPRAERLLIKGFFQEVIDRLPIGEISDRVSDEVFGRFVAAQEEGRVV